MTHIQNCPFQLSRPYGLHFEHPIAQEYESFEKMQKFRKLGNYSQQAPSNLYQGAQRETINQGVLSLQPIKAVVKGLYENKLIPESGAMMNLESPMSKAYQSQLEKMKQVGQSQQSQIEKHIMYKKSLSLSTASCSPNIEDELKSSSPVSTTDFNAHWENLEIKRPVILENSAQGFETCEPRVPEKMYHNLAENQMKTVQAMLTAKNRNSQINNIPNQRSLYEGPVQDSCNQTDLQTMRNPAQINGQMIQRANAYRAMQYRFAMQQRLHYIMQQKLLQNNQMLKNYSKPQTCNINMNFDSTKTQGSQILNGNEKPANKIEDIDIFFRSFDSESEELSPFRDSFSDAFNNMK